MIVGCDNDERNLFDRRDVHSLVKRTRLHAAFTDATQTDEILFAFETLGHQRAHRHRNHRAEMTDHGELALERKAAVNIAIAPAHRALPRAEIRAGHIDQRLTESRSPSLIANQRSEDISLLQK